jgi:hypothetical protein
MERKVGERKRGFTRPVSPTVYSLGTTEAAAASKGSGRGGQEGMVLSGKVKDSTELQVEVDYPPKKSGP